MGGQPHPGLSADPFLPPQAMLIVPSATRADLAVPPAELPQPPSYTEVTERPAERGSPAPSGAGGHPPDPRAASISVCFSVLQLVAPEV